MENALIHEEHLIDAKQYHTVYEAKIGQGPAPLKTPEGWLPLAHGVRHTAAGLRYVLYLFMTALDKVSQVIPKPGGYFLAPEGDERICDVSTRQDDRRVGKTCDRSYRFRGSPDIY